MENKNSNQTPLESSEKPSSVVADILIKTLITLVIGGLVMYSGLI